MDAVQHILMANGGASSASRISITHIVTYADTDQLGITVDFFETRVPT